ncbi:MULTISPECIES: outer membrane lipoprotein chaperone LolA [Providencia]|uniref:Outer-membrane lipoprotein carrier protein n=2 Tax=Providencia TaxID=586 RepID=A0AA42FQI2_9GAMM|nr:MULTISPECIES: outer membrane lipoprotein chaperone LolA [Providencia]HCI96735.1 outer membrane lipoprotein chaperone LolA [Providencia sp.]APC10970.1 Outer-membrane lipoprotein carrier protein precursor [Providencia rettgeri]AVL74515.1 outer membrane lipoprotein chaperone LolA [Providencia rettgeri]EIL1984719.1 outer membrane lipoprotein chaperone LolA [Providencia rettgeri]EIU7559001.1 outer membrane lipoprotein chaperone LolA [Providencia rettgeri]
MKKMMLLGVLAFSLHIGQVLADASQDLQARLNKVNSFQASFSQKVTSPEGDLVQEGVGDLWLERPNLFNWNMTSPDESVLVSDGKNLWFYNPFVEQVTVTNLADATQDTPFLLITRNDPKDWKQYSIIQQGNTFDLKPKQTNGTLKRFSITVSPEGTIEKFSAVEQDGQVSAYQLKEQKNGPVDASKFKFTMPKGVTLDDQRPNAK